MSVVCVYVFFFYRITRDINPGLVNFRNLEQRQFLLGAIGVLHGRKISDTLKLRGHMKEIENTSWKVLAYGIYARVVDVSEIERVSAANE